MEIGLILDLVLLVLGGVLCIVFVVVVVCCVEVCGVVYVKV